ncbi:MAG: lipopolysaccharide kinase InaA family protein [Gammaproteobacteria bacterium]
MIKHFLQLQKFVADLERSILKVKSKSGKQTIIANKRLFTPHILNTFSHLDDIIKKSDMLKDGDTTTVVKSTLEEQPIVIKRYNTETLLDTFKQLIRVTRAYNAWFHAHWLLKNNIFTPKPLATVEIKKYWVIKKSYYIYEYLDLTPLEDILFDQDLTEETLNAYGKKITALFEACQKARISHSDFKITNIYVYKENLCLIDLDHIRYHYFDWSLKRGLEKDKRRFLKNFKINVGLYEFFSELLG